MTGGRRPRSAALRAWGLRLLLRAPLLLGRIGDGRLFGHRALVLVHRGRRSGRRYETMLEVLRFDAPAREAFVLSGFGRGAQWLRNLRAGSPAEVRIAGERRSASWRELPVAEAAAVLGAYERRHRLIAPLVHVVLSRLGGQRYDGSADARVRLVERLPVLAFQLHDAARR